MPSVRLSLFELKRARRLESVLISAAGATDELRNGGYFDHVLSIEDIVNGTVLK